MKLWKLTTLLSAISLILLGSAPAEQLAQQKEQVVAELTADLERMEQRAKQTPYDELWAYSHWRFNNINPRRRRAAQALIPKVIYYAKKYQLDYLLIAVVMHAESSWRPGSYNPHKGERGLMQVHGVAARGFDLDTIDGQIESGVKFLKFCIDKCGSIAGGLAYYQTGYKCEPFRLSKRRHRLYKNALKRFRYERKI